MKCEALILELKRKDNIKLYEMVDDKLVELFRIKYSKFKDKFFFNQFINIGGFIVDNWVRIYGCGELNVLEKNKMFNNEEIVDILIGEDVLGGLFGIKDESVFYLTPDTNEWFNMNIAYTQFLDWLINNEERVNVFYKGFRWKTWRSDCELLNKDQGYHFYPTLQFNYDIEERDKKVISIEELIKFNIYGTM